MLVGIKETADHFGEAVRIYYCKEWELRAESVPDAIIPMLGKSSRDLLG